MDIRKIIREELRKVISENKNKSIVGSNIINVFPFSELGDNRQDGFTRSVPNWGQVHLPSLETGDATTTIFSKEDILGGEDWVHPKTGNVLKNPGYINIFKTKYGEEPIFSINPDASWYDKVEILNPKFIEWRKDYNNKKSETLKSWGTTNESEFTDNIVDKKTMDTPTGSLFIIDLGDSSE